MLTLERRPKFRMGLLAKIKWLLCRFMLLTEFCHACGVRQPLVWWCDSDDVWREVTGCRENGIFCPKCFDLLARKRGIAIRWHAHAEYRFNPKHRHGL